MSSATSTLTRYGFCVALLATSSLAAAAGQDLAERVAACAREHDDTARLACFDRLTEKPAAAASTSAPAPQAPAAAPKTADPPVASAAAASTAVAPAAATTAAAAGTAAGAAAASSTKSAVDDFGVTGSDVARQRDADAQKQPGAPEKIDRINASVTALSTRGHGEIVVTLDNGQVWAQKEATYIPIKVGDKVTILAGALHSYRLVASGRVTPVTRIQ
jgi:hypothetical protein